MSAPLSGTSMAPRWVLSGIPILLGTALAVAGCGKGQGSGVGPIATAAAAGSEVRFTDVTRESGVDFVQKHGGCGKAYFVEQTGAGVALLDADGDGDLDLFFPQPTWLPGCEQPEPLEARLYLNQGNMKFAPVPGAGGATSKDYGIGAAAADYDDDGKTDLFVSCYGLSHLYHNEGGGRFKDVTLASELLRRGYSTSAAWLDYDRDGHLDLFVCGYVKFDPKAVTHCPAPDGSPDYCTPEVFSPDPSSLFRNRGDGTFEDVTARAGLAETLGRALGVVATDFDGDGWTDLFVANDSAANMLFRNEGNGHFVDEAMVRGVAYGLEGQTLSNMGLGCADYDRDGDPDLFITTFAAEPFTLFQNSGSYFKDASAAAGLASPTYLPLGFGTAFLDADQDGRLDLFCANGHVEQHISQRSKTETFAQANQFFRGRDDATFVEVPAALPKDDVRVHRGLAVGDLDGDGDLDVVTTSLQDRPTLLRNDSRSGHWISVLPKTRGGSACLGAQVRIQVGNGAQTGWVMGGGSYLAQSDYAVHFGLGPAATVDRVEVRFPGGETQVLTGVRADQRVAVTTRGSAPSTQSKP